MEAFDQFITGKFKQIRENYLLKGTSVSFMPGFILDTASAVGDRFVICSSVNIDIEPAGPVIFHISLIWWLILLHFKNKFSLMCTYQKPDQKQTSKFRTWKQLIGIVKLFLKDLDSFF